MRWSVLKEEKEAEQMFAWKYLIMPYLRSLLEKSGCGGDEQKSVKKGGNG